MDQYVERRIGDLIVRIDRWGCVGFADCIAAAPDLFELDERGLCAFRAEAAEIDRERLIRACDVCPVDALAVYDDAGNQLV
ncbi:MAG: ferredoxin [Longimicrobiales bacterium]